MDVRTQNVRQYNKNLVKVFTVVNPTAGTGIAQAIEDAFAATAAALLLRNTGVRGYVRPKYARLRYSVAPASGTAAHCRIALDKGATRWSSGGSSLTPKNVDMSSDVAAKATCRAGALVLGAATANVRYVSQSSPMSVIPVVGDNLIIAFGDDQAKAALGTLAGNTARQIVIPAPPITLGPNQEMAVHLWYPSNAVTAASWELEACWEESVR